MRKKEEEEEEEIIRQELFGLPKMNVRSKSG